jgi:Protein of unknown function (DUF2855)
MRPANPTLVVHHQGRMRHEIQDHPASQPAAGEILVRIDKFGLTSNNVTYAALGQKLGYFSFFPRDSAWSALPVWGLATAIASRAEGVPEGARLYGYFPAAREATLAVASTTPTGFRVDRPALPAEFRLYGEYSLLDRDPFYLPAKEDLMVVMRPLFLTGLLLADSLAVSKRLGADAVLISSAASKTSYGLAQALRATGDVKLIGLASTGSKAAAVALDSYDSVLGYDELSALDPALSVAYVDVAGSLAVRQRLAQALGQSLRGIIAVGLTHWNEGGYGGKSELGVPVETFFAPGWSARRQKELGAQFFTQLRAGWLAQMESAERHFKLVQESGSAALLASFAALVAGHAEPDEACIHAL